MGINNQYRKDVEQLLTRIDQFDMNKLAQKEQKAKKAEKHKTKWRRTFTIVGIVAGVAALVSAVALLLFATGVIAASACTVIIVGGVFGIVSASGGLYLPLSRVLKNFDAMNKVKIEKEELFQIISRIKTLYEKMTKKREDLKERILQVIQDAREAFPSDAPLAPALEINLQSSR